MIYSTLVLRCDFRKGFDPSKHHGVGYLVLKKNKNYVYREVKVCDSTACNKKSVRPAFVKC